MPSDGIAAGTEVCSELVSNQLVSLNFFPFKLVFKAFENPSTWNIEFWQRDQRRDP
jgi:hypothetical protein